MVESISRQSWKALGIIFVLTALYQLIFAYSLTPLSVNEGFDSLVFKQMGLAMLHGKVPYLDLFDHKGPVIYFINALCQLIIPGKFGLFLFHVLNISLVSFFWYKISLLFAGENNRNHAFWPVVAGILALLWVNNEGGNLTEDWSLLPISYSLYVFAQFYVTKKEITQVQLFYMGIGMGAVTFLRVNNMIAICCVVMVYSVLLLKAREWKVFFKMFLSLFLGWISVIFFCTALIYSLYGLSGVEGMLYGTFLFNFEYMAAPQAVAGDRLLWYVLYGLTFALLSALLFKKYGNDSISHLILLCFLGSFLAIGTKGWCNYYIIFAPIISFSIAAVYYSLNKWARICLIVFFIFFVPYYALKQMVRVYDRNAVAFYNEASIVIDKIPRAERNDIWNYADFTGLAVLHKNNLIQANRVIIPFQLEVSEKLKTDETTRFIINKPKWIFLSEPGEKIEKDAYIANYICINYKLQYEIHHGRHNLFVYRKSSDWE